MRSQNGLRERWTPHAVPPSPNAATTCKPDDSVLKVHPISRKAKIRRLVRIGYGLLAAFGLSCVLTRERQTRITASIVKPRVYSVPDARREARPILDRRAYDYWSKHRRKRGDSSDDESSDTDTDTDKGAANECKYMHEWQSSSFPTCNHLHQVTLEDIHVVNNGHYRDVFSFKEWDGNLMVMKELRIDEEEDFDFEGHFEQHRRDAVAMERLTASENIPDIYAACQNAAIVDLSPDGDLEQHVLKEGDNYKNYKPLEKLEIAYQVASAIADVHEADIAHTDIAPKQFLLINGMYRLNDFNRCRFMTWNEHENRTCTFYVSHNPGKGRSPEEYRYEQLTQKIDVYSMGNVFYYMLVGFKYFDGVKTKKAQKKVIHGGRPELTDDVKASQNEPSIRAILRAMHLSQKQKPADRPTAREISDYLLDALKVAKVEERRQRALKYPVK
mmetsp:Transcript_36201/g.79242  ORF Transcript_36201/g.79242 Transcript_36201/m.79242 type:complete len:444 (+) Transcript_36201:51-1382(+)